MFFELPLVEFVPAALFKRAITAAYKCLTWSEGSVQVSLAALELMAGLAQLQIETVGK